MSKRHAIPLAAFLITGSTAMLVYGRLHDAIPYVVFKYPIAIVALYAFFLLIAHSERQRSAQLDEVGLLRPLRDGAFLVCLHAHLRDLGIDLNIVSPASSLPVALISWVVALVGYYAGEQPRGLPARLIDILPIVTPATRRAACRGFVLAGLIGAVGTFAAIAQPLWLVIPLIIASFRAYWHSKDGA